MKLLIIFVLIVTISVFEVTASYGLFFIPNAPITTFKSTLLVPATSSSNSNTNNIQAVWPGLQNEAADSVLQNLVENQDGGPQTWWFEPFFCCNPAKVLSNGATQVYPGDTIVHDFELSLFTNIWSDQWTITPGAKGQAAQEPPSKEQIFWNPADFSKSLNNTNLTNILTQLNPEDNPTALNEVLWAVELQADATWDFGSVTWSNIEIVAETTSTAWCTNGPRPDTPFKFTFSTPKVQIVGSYSVCTVDTIVLLGPN